MNGPLRVLDLFSGIGGISLGLERTGGFRTVAFCEIDPYCRAVLRKHWPDVPIFEDVRLLTGADVPGVDVIAGGFPCQDISIAGKRAGIEGERSGLWSEYARLVREIRPRLVLVENVSALLGRGLDRVLGDLAEIWYDAEWHCIPASAVGAPHERDRIWIVAYTDDARRQEQWRPLAVREEQSSAQRGRQTLADSDRSDGLGWGRFVQVGRQPIKSQAADDGDAGGTQWSFEPDVGRVAHGVPARVDRLCALGNSVVPQVVEAIGRAILSARRGGDPC